MCRQIVYMQLRKKELKRIYSNITLCTCTFHYVPSDSDVQSVWELALLVAGVCMIVSVLVTHQNVDTQTIGGPEKILK